MSNKSRKKGVSLEDFKKKVGCMLESISHLSSEDQTEAFGFLQDYVNILGSQKSNIPNVTPQEISTPDSTSSDKDYIREDNGIQEDAPSSSSFQETTKSEDEQFNLHETVKAVSETLYADTEIIQNHYNQDPTSEHCLAVQPDSASSIDDAPEYFSTTKPSKSLSCTECGAKAKTRRAMLTHLDRHLSTSVSCRACRKTFNSLSALEFHYDDFCVNKKFECPQCDEVFFIHTLFNNHMEGHERNNCRACPALFTNRKNLVVHMAEAHSVVMLADAAFSCKARGCDRRFVKRSSLHRHMQLRHTEEGQQVCITCGLYLEGEKAYKAHIQTHKQWTCEECSETFTRRQQYLVHVASHKESKYRCLTCDQTLPTKARVLEHRKEGHEVDGLKGQYACNECDRKFLTSSELRDHAVVHKPGTIPCKFCEKMFTSQNACSLHMRKQHSSEGHSLRKESSLICEHCGKQFRQSCLLAKHLRSVHNEQMFSCPFCDHRTNNEVNLRRHLALHTTQEQQYVCEQCGAAFQALSTLKDHYLFVHSNERNFTCEVCRKTFKRRNDLTRHSRSHSDDRSYVCHCKQSYKFMAHLRRHQEAAHKTVTNSRKVERLVPDATGKLVVERPKPAKEKVEKGVSTSCEASICGEDNEVSQLHDLVQGQMEEEGEAGEMQLLAVDDHQAVASSVTDLQISDQQVDPFSIQVAYEGLSFPDSKTQLVYTSPPVAQVMSFQLPQFELVEPNLSYTSLVMNNSGLPHSHGPMLMSIASVPGPQPVMTLITELESNALFAAQTDIGTMTDHSAIYPSGVMGHDRNVNVKQEVLQVNSYTGPSVLNTNVMEHQKASQADMSTMTDVYNSVYVAQPNMCVSESHHDELATMSFPQLDSSHDIMLTTDQDWQISQEPLSLGY